MAFDLVTLPFCVVTELNRVRRGFRLQTARSQVIGCRYLLDENRERNLIADDMVHTDKQEALVWTADIKADSQRRLRRQFEGRERVFHGHLLGALQAQRGGVIRKWNLDDLKRRIGVVLDHLDRAGSGDGKTRAQRLVPRHDVAQRLLEGRGAHPAGQPQKGGDME
jgi:hypothetical protein